MNVLQELGSHEVDISSMSDEIGEVLVDLAELTQKLSQKKNDAVVAMLEKYNIPFSENLIEDMGRALMEQLRIRLEQSVHTSFDTMSKRIIPSLMGISEIVTTDMVGLFKSLKETKAGIHDIGTESFNGVDRETVERLAGAIEGYETPKHIVSIIGEYDEANGYKRHATSWSTESITGHGFTHVSSLTKTFLVKGMSTNGEKLMATFSFENAEETIRRCIGNANLLSSKDSTIDILGTVDELKTAFDAVRNISDYLAAQYGIFTNVKIAA